MFGRFLLVKVSRIANSTDWNFHKIQCMLSRASCRCRLTLDCCQTPARKERGEECQQIFVSIFCLDWYDSHSRPVSPAIHLYLRIIQLTNPAAEYSEGTEQVWKSWLNFPGATYPALSVSSLFTFECNKLKRWPRLPRPPLSSLMEVTVIHRKMRLKFYFTPPVSSVNISLYQKVTGKYFFAWSDEYV